jgi:hypothetical protein
MLEMNIAVSSRIFLLAILILNKTMNKQQFNTWKQTQSSYSFTVLIIQSMILAQTHKVLKAVIIFEKLFIFAFRRLQA